MSSITTRANKLPVSSRYLADLTAPLSMARAIGVIKSASVGDNSALFST